MKPKLKLTNVDGNAFMVIGAAAKAAKKAKMQDAQWQAIKKDMMSGDYDHLLQVVMTHFEVS